ncbi:signal recognition particle-docking protein FtsY [Candidatus Woesearchaeota archaeon]|nr:signal recognition particle-docking protein FtsY [Candidatus Woesearchaeota archaeon]|tara:strand:- start:7135 stop:8241 length:1107 start_codon:yes stop_codon:yes gene_type:complete
MFNFLRKKLKDTISRFSKNVEKEGEKEEVSAGEVKEEAREEKVPEVKEQEAEEEKPKEEAPKKEEAKKEDAKEEKPEKKKFFGKIKEKIVTTKINEQQFEKLFWDLEVALLENNTAADVISKIKEDIKERIVDKPISRTGIEKEVKTALKDSLEELFDVKQTDLIAEAKKKKPFVVCFVGINGSGKTTSIAKVANLFLKNNIKPVLAAADTWRKAAIEQLEVWGNKLNVPVIKHDYGSDPAAVAFDAISMAKARKLDAVLIDTAGRMHSNQNLMDELKKIDRVANPDLTIFVGESITGNDCCNQIKEFNDAVSIDAIILTKADVDEKGGAMISASYMSKRPIIFLGTGQTLDSLEKFEKEKIIESIGL